MAGQADLELGVAEPIGSGPVFPIPEDEAALIAGAAREAAFQHAPSTPVQTGIPAVLPEAQTRMGSGSFVRALLDVGLGMHHATAFATALGASLDELDMDTVACIHPADIHPYSPSSGWTMSRFRSSRRPPSIVC